MKIKSTTEESADVFGRLRECVKYGPLAGWTSYPTHIEPVTRRVNCHLQYVDMYFTTNFRDIGKAKFRLYRNDLEITFGRKTLRIPDLERYYTDKYTITLQKTDRMHWLLCDEIMRLISEEINHDYPNRYKGYNNKKGV